MGFFSKIFGGEKSQDQSPKQFAEYVLNGIIERAEFDIQFDVQESQEEEGFEIKVELSGNDEDVFTEKNRSGVLLDSMQLFLKKALQHHFSGQRANVSMDCNGYREGVKKSLIALAEKLMNSALDQGKTVYVRSLPPKDRKVIHQYLAEDGRVKSRSVGDGLFKKIKIYPVQNEESSSNDQVY